MKPVIYVDVLFVVNAFINYILLYVTSKLAKLPTTPLRLLFGALAGAVYAVCMFFPQVRALYTVASKFAVSLVLVGIAFRMRRLRTYIRVVCIFYLASFTFGGVTLALLFFTNAGLTSGTVLSNGIFYFNLPWKTLLLSTGIAYAVISVVWRIYKKNRGADYRRIYILLNDKAASLNALVDTGNQLCDPITHTPVLIAEYDSIKCLLPDTVCQALLQSDGDIEAVAGSVEQTGFSGRFRVIPFTSLGTENGLLVGFRPDAVHIGRRAVKNVIVGIYQRQLSHNHEYNALLSPEIIGAGRD